MELMILCIWKILSYYFCHWFFSRKRKNYLLPPLPRMIQLRH